MPSGPAGLHPAQPLPQVRLVDAAERREPARGVAVHRRVADGGLAAIRCRQQDRVAQVREHPDRRRAHARLDVLQRDVVLVPVELAADRVLERRDVAARARGSTSITWNTAPIERAIASAAARVTLPEFSVGWYAHASNRFVAAAAGFSCATACAQRRESRQVRREPAAAELLEREPDRERRPAPHTPRSRRRPTATRRSPARRSCAGSPTGRARPRARTPPRAIAWRSSHDQRAASPAPPACARGHTNGRSITCASAS